MESIINLSKGHPTESLYAHDELARAARSAAAKMESTPATFSLDYGNEGCSQRFAAAMAGLLAEEDEAAKDPAAPSVAFDLSDRLFVTNGVSHALDVVAAVLARPGDCCLTEAATYFLAVDIFRSHGLNVDAAPPCADGSLDIDALATQLRAGSFPALQLLYLCPVHSNPTGNTLGSEDRAKLVALALEFQFYIVADEVYHFLDWPGSGSRDSSSRSVKPARMCAFDPAFLREGPGTAAFDVYSSSAPMASEGDGSRGPAPKAGAGDPASGVVVSLSSFSKVLGAGLRFGWVEAAPDIITALSTHPYVLSGGGVAPFMGASLSRGVQLKLHRRRGSLFDMCVAVHMRRQNRWCAKSLSQATNDGFSSGFYLSTLQG
jgi:DNA-binding transcriptional MocR family regulator